MNTVSFSRRMIIPALLFVLIPFYFVVNIVRLYLQQINANDFAIYQQAIYELSVGKSLNPFISVRNF